MIKNFICIENIFKRVPTKGYCFQIGYNKPKNFLWTIFNFDIKILDNTRYFGIYITLFGDLFNVGLDWTRRTDHAGFTFDVSLLWLIIHTTIYDTRHWDYDKEDWCKYD